MTNDQVISQGIGRAREIIDNRILNALTEVAFDLEESRPFKLEWTHNLLDSIGCGIYKDGSLRKYFIPQRGATEPRAGDDEFPIDSRRIEFSESDLWEVPDGVDVSKAWWGKDELFEMITNPPIEIQTSIGWALYYVAAMPYSQIVDAAKGGIVLKEEQVERKFRHFIKFPKV